MGKQMRMTKQRAVILEELRKVDTHPTADEVYLMVRERLPRISLGTVYRNLELLSNCGEIQTLDVNSAQKRFDGNPHPHLHVRCVYCGCIADVHSRMDPDWEELQKGTDFQITGYSMQLYGICPQCQDNGSALTN